MAVILSHAATVAGEPGLKEPLAEFTHGQTSLGGFSVGIFFLISGLLVTKSARESRSVKDYAVKRALRILPGLWGLMLVTVFFIGPLMTTLPLAGYFGSASPYRYLQGAFFRFGTELTGVFVDNRYPRSINNSLWSVRIEVLCYALVALSMLVGRPGFRRWSSVGALAVMSGMVLLGWGNLGGRLSILGSLIGVGPIFFLGAAAYEFRERVWLSIPWGIATGLAWLIVRGGGEAFWALNPLFAGYVVLVVGLHPMLTLPRIPRDVDVSYGVYLYGFPIQQCVESLVGCAWGWNALITWSIVLPLSLFSWVYLENPVLRMKRILAPRVS